MNKLLISVRYTEKCNWVVFPVMMEQNDLVTSISLFWHDCLPSGNWHGNKLCYTKWLNKDWSLLRGSDYLWLDKMKQSTHQILGYFLNQTALWIRTENCQKKKEIQKWSTSLSIRKMQIKTILRFYIFHNDYYKENGTANGSVIKITCEAWGSALIHREKTELTPLVFTHAMPCTHTHAMSCTHTLLHTKWTSSFQKQTNNSKCWPGYGQRGTLLTLGV